MKLKEYILSHTFKPEVNDNLHFTFKTPSNPNCKCYITLEQLTIKTNTSAFRYTDITIQLTEAELNEAVQHAIGQDFPQYLAAYIRSRLIIKLYNYLIEQEFIQPIKIIE